MMTSYIIIVIIVMIPLAPFRRVARPLKGRLPKKRTSSNKKKKEGEREREREKRSFA